MRWRLELSPYSYHIIYRPGDLNTKTDALSQIGGSIQVENVTLQTLHNNICHPRVTRMAHYARRKNLPYTMEEIQRMTISCQVCAELKPRFFKGDSGKLIKATAAFERLNIDFKEPLPSTSNISSQTVSKCLTQLFYLFGMPAYIHMDRRSSFMSNDLKTHLHSLGVITPRMTAHNPQVNGQAERYNGIIWKSVTLALRSHLCRSNMLIDLIRHRIGLALHSLRTLLSTALLMSVYLVTSVEHLRLHPFLLIEEVELLEAYPKYAHVRLTDRRETTVSLRHLTPAGGKCVAEDGNSDETQVGTGAPDEDGEKEQNSDANDRTQKNSESEVDTATRDEPHQTPP
ncbi:Gag-Pol polyprotein [Trichinella papuae]|uniref:Gag-Pol polyprotein n=1 Tax=Trichinella papuae TaxID=268474 RepID=A0A0V1MTU5_9BILA|nr:Gag-Pol polyprotein [Trichinella papuae]